MASPFERYVLPGVIFMAVVVGGGYATGREIAQFILPLGPWGGLLGQLVAAATWSMVLAISFELVRTARTYDYRSFIGVLLGRGWILFEIAYLALLVVALAVFGAAAGSIAADSAGLPPLAGTLTLMALIGALVFQGNKTIERVLSAFALLLYVIYIVIVVRTFLILGERIEVTFASATVSSGWVSGGIIYAGYNAALIPAVLFCLRHQTRRREALISGLLAGPIAMLPGVWLFVSMQACYPEIASKPVPVAFLLTQLEAPWFERLFEIVLFGILVKCGAALLHSINERVASALRTRDCTIQPRHRSIISITVLLFSLFAATKVGIVDLVAKGYGGLTFAFIILFILPLLTVGVWKIMQARRAFLGPALQVWVILSVGLLVSADTRADTHANPSADRARVTALADRYMAEYKVRFPIPYDFSGLPSEHHDGLNINSPADLAKWRAFEQGLDVELHRIQPDTLAGQPEWVTWHFLNQELSQQAKTAVCRSELWNISPLGWQTDLAHLADLQPVGSAEARAQALARWRRLGPWIDQEIANLRAGQQLGFTATRATVQTVIEQLDGAVNGPASKSGFLPPAERDKTPAFVADWTRLVEGSLLPAMRRYRDFLRDEYLPHARKNVSIDTHPNGRECYRALIFASVTLEVEPVALYDVAVKQVAKEHTSALELGRKVYGDKAKDWNGLAQLVLADPNNRFASSEEVRDYTQRTYERAYAAASKMVLTPPLGQVKLEPFPEFQQASAPAGEYLPAADDGSRPGTYYYRNVPKDLSRTSLRNVILHETLPGHHLQGQFLAEHGHKGNHPIGRLLFFSGPGEGWATYAEDFGNEIGLYASDLEYIGRIMDSLTPIMVADLGMQVKGWSAQEAIGYLEKAMPLRPPPRAKQTVATLGAIPGRVLAYPLGGMEWTKMRARAEASLGKRFDVRAFHQMELEDGMLPFAALETKLDRWIEAGGPAQ